MKKVVKVFVLMLIICISMSLFACNSDANNDMVPSENAVNAESGNSINQNYDFVNEGVDRKIVYNVNMNITVTDIVANGAKIVNAVKSCGGWIQSSNESTYSGRGIYYYTLRIPTAKLDEFLGQAEGTGSVNTKTITSQDITIVYVTATAKKSAIEEEIAALNALDLKTTNEILQRSARISELTAQLGALELQINSYDSITEFSTVTIELNTTPPVKENVPFGQKIGKIFKASLASVVTVFKGLSIGIVAVSPYAVIIGVIVIIVLLIRFLLKKYKPLEKLKFWKKKDDKAKKENKQIIIDDIDKDLE